jgi:hypothetical protein
MPVEREDRNKEADEGESLVNFVVVGHRVVVDHLSADGWGAIETIAGRRSLLFIA